MNFEVKKLSPGFGAEIFGLDLAKDRSKETIKQVLRVWRAAGGLLVAHNQNLTSVQHIEFSRHFGPLFGDGENQPLQATVSKYIHPDHPQIYRVSNQTTPEGEPLGRKGAGTYWHSDVSFRECPAQASILHGKNVPDCGGDTIFSDQVAAYAALTDAMKKFLAPLKAWHDFEVAAKAQYVKSNVVKSDIIAGNRALHPVVRTHIGANKKSIYVNPGFTSHIEGYSDEESVVILNFLYKHCISSEFTYRHNWSQKDLVIWDNRALMHYAVMDYDNNQVRYMERCTVIGEKPI